MSGSENLISRSSSFFWVVLVLSLSASVSFGVEAASSPSTVYKRNKIVLEGDLMIGALLPVHEQPGYNDNEQLGSGAKRKCGVIRDQYGVQRVEALLYMIDKLNDKNRTNILPGIKLGLEIRDECWETSIALEETIDFIKDTISINEHEIEASPSSSVLQQIENSDMSANSSLVPVGEIDQTGGGSSLSLMEQCQKYTRNKQAQNKIMAVIGPAGSSVSINVQNLLQLFDIPQIGYSATSRDLSDKKMFKTFLRVVPSDYLQVKAMIDVVQAMNWTYLFAIYTDGSYGQAGMEAFRNETSYLNICLALYEKIREYASDEDYELVIRKMNSTTNARVIVCFCYGETIRGLLGAIKKLDLKGRFVILGSDGWSDRIDVAKDYYDVAEGSFSIKAYSPKVVEFDNYFINLNPSNNKRNVWFNEYWEELFKCYVDESSKSKFTTPCTRKCPTGFAEIGPNCYWFSSTNLNWHDAKKECKDKYFNANLIDLSEEENVMRVINYMINNQSISHLSEIHANLKLEPMVKSDSYTESSAEKYDQLVFNDENMSGEKTIKLKSCMHYLDNGMTAKNSEGNRDYINTYEASLTDENVITFFDSKINQKLKCLSIVIYNTTDQRITYCLKFKNCTRKLPYVCEIQPGSGSSSNSKTDELDQSKADNFYPDTLRNYVQDPKMSFVINSLLAVTYGLDRVHKKYCNGVSGLCDKMKKVNGSELLKNIKESSFLDINQKQLYFDQNGDPPGRYVILNVQKDPNADESTMRDIEMYKYIEVGNWNNDDRLKLDISMVKFPENSSVFTSLCSAQCDYGHVKQIKQGGLKCCWNCKKCEEYAYVLDEFTCQECQLGYWPNRNMTGCEKLPLTYLKWNEIASLLALLFSCIGIAINTFITYVFIKYANTSLVKSTTRELSYIILVGIYLCYAMTIPLILKPTVITCYLYRSLPGISLSLIYGSLITKTNRIARILSSSKKRILTHKPRFMSLTAQIVITCIIIAIAFALVLASILMEPGDWVITYPRRNVARLECKNSLFSIIMPIGYNFILVVLCTLYAVKTRNLPENFNEAKFIGFSMYTTCVIWIAFIPLYFGSDFKIITICLSTSFSATVILVFLFIPKVYIILFKPEKNQRSAFATAKDIRCHFGAPQSGQTTSFDDNSNSKKNSNGKGGKLTGTKLNFARYAYRPKLILNNMNGMDNNNNKSLESGEASYASLYQIYDRSCQTSMELIDPIVERVIKKRKIETSSLVDEKEMHHSTADAANDLDKAKSVNNVTLSALGNFLILPLMTATTPGNFNANMSGSNDSSSRLINSAKSSMIAKSSKKSSLSLELDSDQPPSTPTGKEEGATKKQKTILLKNSIKKFVYGSDKKPSSSSHHGMKREADSKGVQTGPLPPPPVSVTRLRQSSSCMIRTSNNDINEESGEETRDDETREEQASSMMSWMGPAASNSDIISHERSTFDPPLEEESPQRSVNHPVDETQTPALATTTTNVAAGDNSSLDEFKKVFNKNKNFVVNWEYVESSDYL